MHQAERSPHLATRRSSAPARTSPGALRSTQALLLSGALALLAAAVGCTKNAVPSKTSDAVPGSAVAPMARVEGNPFTGAEFFVPPYTNADQARRRLERSSAADAALLAKIADTPQARWFGEWSGDIATVTDNYVKAAHNRGKVALLVAYNIPNRDCGQYSAGGAVDPANYRRWIQGLAKGISPARRAVVILEPDALGHLEECLSAEDQKQRLALLAEAVDTLEALPGVAVYLDAGHSRWHPADKMSVYLEDAGVRNARGFALNVSNYIGDDELIAYGEQIAGRLGESHFIIDSSRNGNGPTADNQWCNPAGRALGRRPGADSSSPHLDAFVWAKNPGESDGECGGGPKAGQWFEARALEMARGAQW
jgi:endoglucanase